MNYKEKIDKLVCPDHWIADGSEHPNFFAKRNTILVCDKILSKYKLLPIVIAPTIENGVYLKYLENNKELIVETYNDDNVIACIVENKKTLYCSEIKDLDFKDCFKFLRK